MNKQLTRLLILAAPILIAVLAIAFYNSQNPVAGAQNTAQVAAVAPAPPVVRTPHQLYDASTAPVSAEPVKQLDVTFEDKIIEIAPDVPYQAWTFNGTVPGPILRVRQGDTVQINLTNKAKSTHSLDFHSAQTPWNISYKDLAPGDTFTYEWTAHYPGIFMYHCGTAPALAHIANGMYGAIIVEPAEGLPAAKEYVLVQSEFFAKKGSDGVFQYDGAGAVESQPDYVVFNGYANQYKESPLTANPGERVRLWVLNAGPSEFSAFHIVGTIFDQSHPDGNPQNVETGRQTVTIPPGGGYMVELTVPDAGLYPVVTHAFAHPGKGALGLLKIGDVTQTTGMSH